MPTILGGWVKSPASAAARLPTRSGRAPAVDMPSSSAWLTAGGWEASSRQWAAANQPEATRATPATNATATRASLFRGDRGLGAGAGYGREFGAGVRCGRELGAGVRYGAAVIGGAGVDRGGFRCLAT